MDVTQSKVNPNCENWTDPFQFSAYRLENGISVLRHADFIPITTVFVYIPFGYAHSIPPNPGGSAHMLEHLITSQSMSSDRLGQFHQQVGLCGGWANAGVASLFTMFVMSVPNQHFDALLPQFAPMIFVPSWEDDQIIKERSIIRNERTSREKWYPGKNPMSYIWQTRWQFDS